MKKLSDLQKDEIGIIATIKGDSRFVSRITSIGITPGCKITIIKHNRNHVMAIHPIRNGLGNYRAIYNIPV
jgi:ferrous iron transport protein A